MSYYVYILYSSLRDHYYIGYTHDLSTRLDKHNAGATPSTRSGIPWKLVYVETYSNKHDAIMRERTIKNKKSRDYINHLIESRFQ